MRILSDTIQVARKHYPCDACAAWLNSGYGERDVTPDEWLVIQGAEAAKWKITPGSKYRRMRIVEDGEMQTVRNRLDVEQVCYVHGFFDE
jgi:hypothetical protein